jgi:hypothetical protein
MAEFDISGIPQPQPVQRDSWRAPRHVYFGPRDPVTGDLAPEPTLNTGHGPYIPYPKHVYRKKADGNLQVRQVNSDAEWESLGRKEWKSSPAELGVITAPSWEQNQAAQAAAVASKLV